MLMVDKPSIRISLRLTQPEAETKEGKVEPYFVRRTTRTEGATSVNTASCANFPLCKIASLQPAGSYVQQTDADAIM